LKGKKLKGFLSLKKPRIFLHQFCSPFLALLQ